jgi:hypothetical protein
MYYIKYLDMFRAILCSSSVYTMMHGQKNIKPPSFVMVFCVLATFLIVLLIKRWFRRLVAVAVSGDIRVLEDVKWLVTEFVRRFERIVLGIIRWLMCPVDVDCRTGSLHLGPCIRAICAPNWNSFLPSSPEAPRTYRREGRKLKRI